MSKETKLTLVRVLATLHLEGKQYEPNRLVEISAADAAKHKKAGSVDDSAGAIAYCKNELGVKVITHTSVEHDLALAQEIAEFDSGSAANELAGATGTETDAGGA